MPIIMSYDSQKVVLDANVMIKIFVEEHDSQIAREFLSYCNQNYIDFLAPSLFKYEVIGVCMQKKVDMDRVFASLNLYYQTSLTLLEPTLSDWQLASKICQDGNDKSGYPSMYDSIYQAMAINKGISFITADNRHYQKAQQHGNIGLLENWQTLFEK